jgi:hypothetical protein
MQVGGGNEDLARGGLVRALTESVTALGEHNALAIARLSPAGLVIWGVRRDQNGTPRSHSSQQVSWSSLSNDGVLAEDKLDQVIASADSGSRWVIVCSALGKLQVTEALGRLRTVRPEADVFHCSDPLRELIREAIAQAPLTQRYELVVLRRTSSGRLALGGFLLFPPGARQGDRQPVTILCEPSDHNGTALAVVACRHVREFQLVSLSSVKLEPRSYSVVAELLRPGLVRFNGLPELLEEHRSWPELVASVPPRLPSPQAAHLICAVETSGLPSQVRERLSRIEQLIRRVADSGQRRLRVSLISYGPHSVDRAVPEEPLAIQAWAASSDAALTALGRLRDHGAAPVGYSRAAQIECVLTEVANRLTGQHGRPVLVTAGARPAFPSKVDPRSEIIPCPKPRPSDWRRALRRLHEHQGIAFGAIHDYGAEDEMWGQLGQDSFARIDVVSISDFAADLGLLSLASQYVPFPLVDERAERAE